MIRRMPNLTPSPSDRARAEQRRASNPATSAFVSAHAGSGKTTLLVDRLLRLMLAGADPARILCLTYTRAAAAEMAIRLQKKLGTWVSLSDENLAADLRALDVPANDATLNVARTLLAHVLDLPGGMRIATIHAFCQSLLKRFPLEAGISPHFQLLDDADARDGLNAAREAVLPEAAAAVLDILAARINLENFTNLLGQLEKDREKLAGVMALSPADRAAAFARSLNLRYTSHAAMMADAVKIPDEAGLRDVLQRTQAHGSTALRGKAAQQLGWLNRPAKLREDAWAEWQSWFLTGTLEPRAQSVFAAAVLARAHTDIIPTMVAEQNRVLDFLEQASAFDVIEASSALLDLATPMLANYAKRKQHAAHLDYDDLIRRTDQLLKDVGSAWVLYKLDAGLDHLLLDEVQDTAPIQWTIAASLTADFFAGESVPRDDAMPRTVFAVGDRKQSIYSFQGARPAEFARWQTKFGDRARAAEKPFLDSTLDVSFRSATPVLGLVDAVFADPIAASGVTDGDHFFHIANRALAGGLVELWPLAPVPEIQDPSPWQPPLQNARARSSADTLVQELARYLAAQLSGGVQLQSAGRPLRPGDVLVLVRHRSQFDRALTRALKTLGVPVAGLDRMKLTEQPAVADLLSLARALLLPQDDLSFAEWLKSPLGGIDEDGLMALAIGRTGSLYDALRNRADERAEWQTAQTFFATLLARADFTTPHALFAEALGPLGGRARLFARLGPEAADPVDELLSQALAYAETHTPSLQGFVHWLENAGTDIKREADAAGNAVRIMTVHGAKGLEAPFVILPDTTSLSPMRDSLVWDDTVIAPAALPLLVASGKFSTRVAALTAERRRETDEEYNRLLYVALTRARDRLLICGWQGKTAKDLPEKCWYETVKRGMGLLGATANPLYGWGDALSFSAPQRETPKPDETKSAPATTALPDFAGSAPHWRATPPAAEPARPTPLAPSRPEGVELGTLPAARSPLLGGPPETKFRRGTLIHALLQHLPSLPPEARHDAAHRYAASAAAGISNPGHAADQALAVLADPALAPLFGPSSRAEQPVQAVIGNQVVAGLIDRLAILPDMIVIADYKTGRGAPASAALTPRRYARQMAAYRAVLQALYPGRPVRCLLIWTEDAIVHELPETLLDAHDPNRLAA